MRRRTQRWMMAACLTASGGLFAACGAGSVGDTGDTGGSGETGGRSGGGTGGGQATGGHATGGQATGGQATGGAATGGAATGGETSTGGRATGGATSTGGRAGGSSGSPDGGVSATGGAAGPDAGTADGGTPATDPLDSPARCTSNKTWTGGDRGSASMNPGLACINCHSSGDGPKFTVAGTLYPTGHEPNLCNGNDGITSGARVVVTGADGKVTTLTPNNVGNFYSTTTIAKPFTVKVTYMGRTRAMGTSPSSGDCNSCHTQNGAMSAPGRITLP